MHPPITRPIRPLFRAIALAVCLFATVPALGCASVMDRFQQGNAYHKEASDAPVSMTAAEFEVLNTTNAYRQGQGLPALVPDNRLIAIARMRSQDMARRDYFAHVSPDGNDVFNLMRGMSMGFWAAGENLARNNYTLKESPAVAMKGWIKSPGHRANLLHPAFGHIGVGLAVAKDGKKYITQVFTD